MAARGLGFFPSCCCTGYSLNNLVTFNVVCSLSICRVQVSSLPHREYEGILHYSDFTAQHALCFLSSCNGFNGKCLLIFLRPWLPQSALYLRCVHIFGLFDLLRLKERIYSLVASFQFSSSSC